MILELQRVGRSFHMGSETIAAVRNVDLSIGPGEVLVLLGPSGAGKSTLLLLAAGIERPDAGTVRFGGRDLRELSSRTLPDHLRENVGIASQHAHLLPGHDALSNVALKLAAGPMSVNEARKRSLSILAKVGLSGRLNHRPAQLSGGEQRRVALARALVSSPPLLLIDEPTANLDSATADEVLDVIAQAARDGAAVLLVTHDDAAKRIATRTSSLRDGEIFGSAIARAA